MTDKVVSQIPNIRHFQSLNLGMTSITDEALTYIASMQQLKTLVLDCDNLNGLAIVRLARNLSEMEKLSLWGLNG